MPKDGVYSIQTEAATHAGLPTCTAALDGTVGYVAAPPGLFECSAADWTQITCTRTNAGDVAYGASGSSGTNTLLACSEGTWMPVALPQGPQGDAGPPGPQGDAAEQDAADSGAVSFVPDEASFSSAFFVEAYCSGCHQPSFVPPSGDSVAIFSHDPAWQSPFQNPNWFQMLDYAEISTLSDAILCGVSTPVTGLDDLPPGCTTLADVPPGFFTQPEKFPPLGVASSGGYGTEPPPVCAFSADGQTCPQPSDAERLEMVAWVLAGDPYR
jgi:hypothetical protein